MDPRNMSNKLKLLIEIKQILIVQVFTIITIYYLQGRQNKYRGNIINFFQDIQGFVNLLSHNPISFDIIIVRQQSSDDPNIFRDFTVRREKVNKALKWLKENNPYYNNIIIDYKILNSLSKNRSIINMLIQF